MDVNSKDEELSDLHIDLFPRQRDLSGRRDLSWDVFAVLDGIIDQFLK